MLGIGEYETTRTIGWYSFHPNKFYFFPSPEVISQLFIDDSSLPLFLSTTLTFPKKNLHLMTKRTPAFRVQNQYLFGALIVQLYLYVFIFPFNMPVKKSWLKQGFHSLKSFSCSQIILPLLLPHHTTITTS